MRNLHPTAQQHPSTESNQSSFTSNTDSLNKPTTSSSMPPPQLQLNPQQLQQQMAALQNQRLQAAGLPSSSSSPHHHQHHHQTIAANPLLSGTKTADPASTQSQNVQIVTTATPSTTTSVSRFNPYSTQFNS